MKRVNMTLLVAGATLTLAGLPEARADMVVVVSAQSTVTKMSSEDLSRIYLGLSTKMKPLDLAEPHMRHTFYTTVTGKDDAQVKAIWSKLLFAGKVSSPREVASGVELVKAVAGDPEAIGYVDRSFVNITVKIVYVVK